MGGSTKFGGCNGSNHFFLTLYMYVIVVNLPLLIL